MSSESYLQVWEAYSRKPTNEVQNHPKEDHDYRERVKRETIRGWYGFFHYTFEEYIYRQWRAYTTPWVFVFWLLPAAYTAYTFRMFRATFPNVKVLGFRTHPNYKLLGPIWSTFYAVWPFFWAYLTYRMTWFLFQTAMKWYQDKGEEHYFWYYDNLYPDFIVD